MRLPRVLILAIMLLVSHAGGEVSPAAYGTRFALPGVPGTLVVTGDPTARAALARVRQIAGNDAVIAVVRIGADAPAHDGARTVASRADAADAGLVSMIGTAGNVLLVGDSAVARELLPGTLLHEAVNAVRSRGGVVAVAGGLAPIVSGHDALGLLPGYIVRVAVDAGDFDELIDRNTGDVGLRLDDNATLVVSGRRARLAGGRAVVRLSRSEHRTARVEVMRPRAMIDLVTLSRAAVARSGSQFPPATPAISEVAGNGTLFIGGGGRMPGSVLRRFVAASGGPDALIVVIPTALGDDATTHGRSSVQMLKRSGARNVVVRHATTPADAETDTFLDPIRRAGGIWFSGGRQWRLVDSYLDTDAHALMHEVLARGGAIGGSSAGASIQAEYMVRGHPLGNRVMMAEGYERGLGFLPGVAIDQHFAQRNRFPDMAKLKRRHPQLIGIGIDEGTVLVVSGRELEVVGEHKVAVYDRAADDPDRDAFTRLEPGSRYDLVARRRLP